MKVTIEKLKETVEEFEKVQSKYSKYGAADSEPWYCFKDGARATIWNREVSVPNSWELYDHAMKCGRANKALSAAARKVYRLLARADGVTIKEFEMYYGL